MKRISLILILALAATGCSIYRPQAVDIPLLETDGETRIDAAVGVSTSLLPDAVTFNGTASHAFTDHVAGQAHVNLGSGVYYMQVAPGLFKKLGEKGVLEGYAGVGYGGSLSRSGTVTPDEGESYSYDYDGRYGLVFAQGNIGWRHLGPFEVAFGLKVGGLLPDFDYYKFSSDDPNQITSHEHYNRFNLLLEPQLQLRLGSEHVKFTTRLGYSWLSDMDQQGTLYAGSEHFIHDLFTLSVGLNFTL